MDVVVASVNIGGGIGIEVCGMWVKGFMVGMEVGIVLGGEGIGEGGICISGVGDLGGVLPLGESSESELSPSDSLEEEAIISFLFG